MQYAVCSMQYAVCRVQLHLTFDPSLIGWCAAAIAGDGDGDAPHPIPVLVLVDKLVVATKEVSPKQASAAQNSELKSTDAE